MKTTSLILLGFAILAVSLAAKGRKNARDLDNAAPEKPASDSAKGDNDAKPAEAPKSKKGAKSAPTDTSNPKKGSKSAPAKKQKQAVDDTDLSIDADDILKDEDEDVEIDGDEVEIPDKDDLTSEDDPVELAKKIRNIKDEEKRQELIDELENLKDEHEKILPGKFYRAAYAALDPKNAEKAAAFWQRNLDRTIAKAKKDMKKAMGKTRGGIGNAVGEAQKLIQADPIGIALRKGESFFLTALADSAKNWGKIASLGHDAVGNVSHFVRAATFPVDGIPILRDIKNNVHNYIEENAQRNKNLSELFASDASSALNYAAKDAEEQANAREQVLKRQFSSNKRRS
ncbi:uncharacterized protein LOC135833936 [Planococcus citri]|uniref:uncharacterized protein LOC135833936 n=1 Tax=Planococcus citri TaxID=170843 RepID=UPI0031F83531